MSGKKTYVPASTGELGLLWSKRNTCHLDNYLQAFLLELVLQTLLRGVIDRLECGWLGIFGIAELNPFFPTNVILVDIRSEGWEALYLPTFCTDGIGGLPLFPLLLILKILVEILKVSIGKLMVPVSPELGCILFPNRVIFITMPCINRMLLHIRQDSKVCTLLL